jgi:hypothetical protein
MWRPRDIGEDRFNAARIDLQFWFIKYPLLVAKNWRRDMKLNRAMQGEMQDGRFHRQGFEPRRNDGIGVWDDSDHWAGS